MSKILGLDIATKTGFVILDDGKIDTFGTIDINPSMSLPQRLNFLSNELLRVIETHKPDYCFIEEVIMGLSGPKVMRYLSRLNGAAILTCYSVFKDRVELYEPSQWKSNSFEGLPGNAKKWQIQLACVKHFNIPVNLDWDEINTIVEDSSRRIKDSSTYQSRCKKDISNAKTAKKEFSRSTDEWKKLHSDIQHWESEIKLAQDQSKLLKKDFAKQMKAISLDITSQTGMTEDVCDAAGVAVCGSRSLET